MKKEIKIEVPSFRWTGVRVCFADADEASDAMEVGDLAFADTVAVEEEVPSTANNDEEKRTRSVVGKNRPRSADWEIALQPMLKPSDAKCYVRSAAPAYRGRTCLNILNIADRCVFV